MVWVSRGRCCCLCSFASFGPHRLGVTRMCLQHGVSPWEPPNPLSRQTVASSLEPPWAPSPVRRVTLLALKDRPPSWHWSLQAATRATHPTLPTGCDLRDATDGLRPQRPQQSGDGGRSVTSECGRRGCACGGLRHPCLSRRGRPCPSEPQRVSAAPTPAPGSCVAPGLSRHPPRCHGPFGRAPSSRCAHLTALAGTVAGTAAAAPFCVLPADRAEEGSLKARRGPRSPRRPRDGDPQFIRQTQGPGLSLPHRSGAYGMGTQQQPRPRPLLPTPACGHSLQPSGRRGGRAYRPPAGQGPELPAAASSWLTAFILKAF